MKYLLTRIFLCSALAFACFSLLGQSANHNEAPLIFDKLALPLENEVYVFVNPFGPGKQALLGGTSSQASFPFNSAGILVQTDSLGDTVAVLKGNPQNSSAFRASTKMPNGNYLIGGNSNEAPSATGPIATFFEYDPVLQRVIQAMSLTNNNGAAPQEIIDLYVDNQNVLNFLATRGGSTTLGKATGDSILDACTIFNFSGQEIIEQPGSTDKLIIGVRNQSIALFKSNDTLSGFAFAKLYELPGAQLEAAQIVIRNATIFILANITEFGPMGVTLDQAVLQVDEFGNLIEAARLSTSGGAFLNKGAVFMDDTTLQVNLILAGSNGQQQAGLGRFNLNSKTLSLTTYNPPNLSMELREVVPTTNGGFMAVGSTIDPFNNFANDGIWMEFDSLAESTVCIGEERSDFTAINISPTTTNLTDVPAKNNLFSLTSYTPSFSPFAPTVENIGASIVGDVTVNTLPYDPTLDNAIVEVFSLTSTGGYTPATDRHKVEPDGSYKINNIPGRENIVRIVPGDTNANLLGTYPDGRSFHEDKVDVALEGCETKKVDIDAKKFFLGIGTNSIAGIVFAGQGNEPKFSFGDPLAKVVINLIDASNNLVVETTTTDNEGNYKFYLLPDGTYNVRADVPRLRDSLHENITVNENFSEVANIDFVLEADTAVNAVRSNPTPITPPILQQSLTVYPNPSQGGPVRFGDLLHNARIYNTEGQIVAQYPTLLEWIPSRLPAGVYYLQSKEGRARIVLQ